MLVCDETVETFVLKNYVPTGVFCAKMSSTQHSKSANHILKNYAPPGCPMLMLVRNYMRLQFDREVEEKYEEKRTRIVIWFHYLLYKYLVVFDMDHHGCIARFDNCCQFRRGICLIEDTDK